jgi:hypothetical protein
MALKTTVSVDGNNVCNPTNYLLKYEVRDTVNDEMTECELWLDRRVLDVVDIDKFNEVIIQRGTTLATDAYIFRGEVVEVDREGPYVKLFCLDKLYVLNRLLVHNTYDSGADPQAGKISAIAKDLIETYGGLTSTETDSGTTNILNKFECVRDVIFERLRRLSAALGWYVHYNPEDDTVHFEPHGTTISTTVLTIGGASNNVVEVPNWVYVHNEMGNDIYVFGGTHIVQTKEFYSANGSQDEFVLSHVPESIEVWVGTGVFDKTSTNIPSADITNLEVGSVPETTGTFDYYFEKDLKTVYFNLGSVPPAGTDNVEMSYSYKRPIAIHLQDDASIEKYGRHTVRRTFNDMVKVNDAKVRAEQLLDTYKVPFVSCNLEVANITGLQASQKIRVIDNIHQEDRLLTIYSITYRYPETTDVLDLGDQPVTDDIWDRNIQERLEQLEKEQAASTDILLEYRSFTHRVKCQRRYLKVQTRDTSGDLLWSRNKVGWNRTVGAWASDFGESLVDQRIVWPDQVFEERFIDEDFNDSGVTSADWDTTNKQLVF